MECDVLVLGAGPAGSCAARFLAEKNLNVILVEQHKRRDVGKKVCGDGITIKGLMRAGIYPPPPNIGLQYISKGRLISPDKETDITLEFGQRDGYCIDRNEFGKYLVDKAEKAGAKLIFEATAEDLIWKDNRVAGAVVNGKAIHAKAVVAATGMSAFRFKTPAGKILTPDDIYVCYRERALVEKPDIITKHIYIYLNQEIAPGGYIWYFPMGMRDNKLLVNFGLGIQGSNPVLKDIAVKQLLDKFRAENSNLFKNYEIYQNDSFNAQGGIVPIRYVLESLVDINPNNEPTGLVYAGDIGSTVDPIHGGGMRYSMDSAFHLAQPVADFIKSGDYTKLWQYNLNYIKELGGNKQGSEYIVAHALQTSSNQELNLLLKHVFVKTDFDALVSGKGYDFEKAKLLGKLAKLALSGSDGRKALIRLFWVYLYMKKIQKIYAEYPDSPAALEAWSQKLHTLLSDYKEKLSKI